ncbi:succinylglutamate desuccinylase/aspartoacylase domain-containing protein [Leisingera sp.]|uniref:succinylglutamate desuccinylase/aspartoacylase domain-containing protein n=1 Tax=Leisingera sp. TaxID=1879318 RepID=UPI002B2747AE|nr:succinylglutamate desuccinylase/aspartoacylase family protein [Leisingera sp.]
MTLQFGTVHSSLDLDRQGKRAGVFGLSHSDDRHEFSSIQSPLSVIRGGDGPTALVCAGNHGDEYEGQIIVRRLYDLLKTGDVAGRLILVPALNMPAVQSISRVSPLDGGNLNRSFPGAAYAGPTQEIAGFVATQLMPEADIAIDLHSGGGNSNYVNTAYFCLSPDSERNKQTFELATVMGLPHTMVVPVSDTPGDFDSAAHDAGCAMISCELGGEGKVTSEALEAGWSGVLRLLVGQGVLHAAAAERLDMLPPADTVFLDLGEGADYVTAQTHSLVEPLVKIGEEIARGQPVIRLRDLYKMETAPQVLRSERAGTVSILRAGAIVAPGDHLCVICPTLSNAELDALMAKAAAETH